MFSPSSIKSIENYYGIRLPIAYKRILLLVGDKMMDFLRKQHSIIDDIEPLSIYKIQKVMKVSEDDPADDEPELVSRLLNVFWLTDFISYKDGLSSLENISYFVDPQEQEDCFVYGWIYDNGSDTNSIIKVANTLEEWLYKLSFPLYVEFKIKKCLAVWVDDDYI
jgi:hypothetical protein